MFKPFCFIRCYKNLIESILIYTWTIHYSKTYSYIQLNKRTIYTYGGFYIYATFNKIWWPHKIPERYWRIAWQSRRSPAEIPRGFSVEAAFLWERFNLKFWQIAKIFSWDALISCNYEGSLSFGVSDRVWLGHG